MKPESVVLKTRAAAFAALASLIVATPPASAGLLRADPAAPSPFLENPPALKKEPDRAPFDRVSRNPSPRAWARVRSFDRIVIMPVTTRYLRHKDRTPARPGEGKAVEQGRPIADLARYMHESFENEFKKGGRYHVVSHPGRKTLVLELALVEVNPTNVAVNVVATGAGAVVPGANFVGSIFSKGSIAMEGKLRNGETGQLLEEFSDREQDKTSLFSFRDYSPYAHSRRAIDDWAKETEAYSRTPHPQKVHRALAVTLNPF